MTCRTLVTLPCLWLTACSIAPAGPLAPQAQPPAISAPTHEQMAGRWDVVSFEGYYPPSRHSAFVTFWPHGASLMLECNRATVPGIVRDGRFVTQHGPRMSTERGCDPGLHERDSRFFAFFDRSPIVERLAGGRLRLVAGETNLVLERPEQRRLAFLPERRELEGRWRMESLMRYGPQDGQSGIGLSDVPGHLRIEGNRLSYDRCPRHGLTFTYGADGRLLKTGGAALPDNADCPQLRPPRQTFDMPTPDQILPLLHSNPWVEEVGNGRMLISNGQLGLLVTKQP